MFEIWRLALFRALLHAAGFSIFWPFFEHRAAALGLSGRRCRAVPCLVSRDGFDLAPPLLCAAFDLALSHKSGSNEQQANPPNQTPKLRGPASSQ